MSNMKDQWDRWLTKVQEQPEFRAAAPPITEFAHLLKAAQGSRFRFMNAAKEIGKRQKKPWNDLQVAKYGEPVWFRGEPNRLRNHKLQPKVYRKGIYPASGMAQRTPEKFMLNAFRLQAISRRAHCPGPDERALWMCLAQHYTLPTRLLDWTESIMTAAWFAAHDVYHAAERADLHREVAHLGYEVAKSSTLPDLLCKKQMERFVNCCKFSDSVATIWALAPAVLNWTSVHDGPIWQLDEDYVSVLVDAAFKGQTVWETTREPQYRNDRIRYLRVLSGNSHLRNIPKRGKKIRNLQDKVNNQILAVKAPQIDPRMMMQQAAFTIHVVGDGGGGTDPATDCDLARRPGDFLMKFTIDADARSTISQELKSVGVHQSTVFPDLHNLAEDIEAEWRQRLKEDC